MTKKHVSCLLALTTVVSVAATLAAAQTPALDDALEPVVAHKTWTRGKAMPLAVKFAMAGVIDDKIYVVGGVTDTAVVDHTQIYDPVAKTWSTGVAFPSPIMDAAVIVVKNVLYIFGGTTDGSTWTNAVWAFDAKTNKWSAKATMPYVS